MDSEAGASGSGGACASISLQLISSCLVVDGILMEVIEGILYFGEISSIPALKVIDVC